MISGSNFLISEQKPANNKTDEFYTNVTMGYRENSQTVSSLKGNLSTRIVINT